MTVKVLKFDDMKVESPTEDFIERKVSLKFSPCDTMAKSLSLDPVINVERKVGYEFTPRDSMGDTLNTSFEGELPKKRAQKIKDETPPKDTYAGNSSKELGVRDSIEFVRPASSRREKTKSKVFDFTPPKFAPRRYPNGIRNHPQSQRYAKSPYATHDQAVSNGVDFARPTTPFAQHEHVSNEQVYSPRRARTMVAIPTTPTPRPFVRPPPGGHCSGIFG